MFKTPTTLCGRAAIGACLALVTPAQAATQIEEYGCSVTVHDLAHDLKEEQSQITMKSDSKLRVYRLDTLKVIAKLDFHSLDKSPNRTVNAYWANRRAVTLSIVDQKDSVQAQFNNTVDAQSGPFEYQTKTTRYFVKLHCDPIRKLVFAE